jgi:hypothetical protein
MFRRNASLFVCKAHSVRTQGAVRFCEGRGGPITGHLVDKRVGLVVAAERSLDLFTEIVRVRCGSVVTVQLDRDHGGEQLALHKRKG